MSERCSRAGGYDVITCLAGRSQRTRDLAAAVGFRDVPSLEDMILQADLIMSILVPAQAMGVAREVADSMRTAGAIASIRGLQCRLAQVGVPRWLPSSARRAEEYIDGGIIGGSPAKGAVPRILYVPGRGPASWTSLTAKA